MNILIEAGVITLFPTDGETEAQQSVTHSGSQKWVRDWGLDLKWEFWRQKGKLCLQWHFEVPEAGEIFQSGDCVAITRDQHAGSYEF